MQDIKPLHPLVSAINIAGDISFRMADMQTSTTWVWEHIEYITLGFPLDKSILPWPYRFIYFILFPKSEPPSVALIVVTHFGERSMNSIKEFL